MKTLTTLAATAAVVLASGTALAAHHEGGMDNKAIARGWYEASCGELDGFIAYVKKHMADDGVFIPERYVGLGFTINNEEGEDFGKVMMVTPNTPAAEVLQPGDRFISVNGMDMTFENRDNLSFRGLPGEAVEVVMERDGKQMTAKVMRGVIAARNSKARVLEGLGQANPEDWDSDSCSVNEVVGEGNVVYVHGEWTDTEEETGYKYGASNVLRLKFNDDGQVVEGWSRGEGRFVLEQLGYTISR